MRWHVSHRFDPRACRLADRHYSRQKPGTPQFVAPGSPLVFLTKHADALWVSLVQEEQMVKHAWPQSWLCTHFRNESSVLSSELILEACAATRWSWGDPPRDGMVTFVDPRKVRPKVHPGRCFLMAGFEKRGVSKKRGYLVLGLRPERFPQPSAPRDAQFDLFRGAA